MAKLLLILSFLIGVTRFHAMASEQLKFVHIGLEKGLSQSTVFDIDQDKKGNMWFATYNGVNKYDGYAFTVYQHDEKNQKSIANDITRTIKVDKQGRVWVGTHEGLSCYHPEQDLFSNYEYKKKGKNVQVNDIVELDSDHLLINTSQGLLLFNIKEACFANNGKPDAALFGLNATALGTHGDYLYIGTNDGLFAYSKSQNKLTTMAPETLKNKQIQVILQQSADRLWVGTEGDGLYLINPQTKDIKVYTDRSGISSNYVRSLALDSQNRLWVGTYTALNVYNDEHDTFVRYDSDPMKSGSLSQTSVRSIFMDSQGGMWLGTFFGGLNYYHPLRNRFNNLSFIANRNSLNDNVVNCIVEEKGGNLWIGTNSGGLNHYDMETNSFTSYTIGKGLGSNDVKSVYVDEKQETVYIGTHAGGLSVLNRKSKKMETYNPPATPIAERSIYAITPTDNGQLWLGTLHTLVRFDPKAKTFTTLTAEKDGTPFKSTPITTLFRDSKHRLWVGSEEGLMVYTQDKGELESARVLPADSPVDKKSINCVYEAQNGTFWIGTRSGAYRFDEKNKVLKQYTTADGLPNNVVYGVLEDSFGRLWMSTDKGLTCLYPQTEKFRNFTSADGIQSNQFNAYAYCRTAGGEMYFGGIKGITTFHPEKLMDNPYIPPVVITSFGLFNATVRPNDESGVLTKHISATERVVLTAEQSVFSVEFVVSDYISGGHNQFAYKLEGYDKEWYYVGDPYRWASYSNLSPGDYRFMVKAANSDGKWNEEPTVLGITILPAWYQTWWAILLFIAAFAGATVLIFRFFWIRKSMRTQLELERIDKERQKEVSEMKMRFFINISHELRTPLTLILAPLQEVLDKVNDRWTRNQLEHVKRNANRLLHLVNQLMDYRRAEQGVFELQVKRNDIHHLVEKNFLFYDRLAQRKKIDYNFYSELEGREVLCDANYLELIINNLLSNAFKYTHEEKSIIVTLKETNRFLLLQVQDTGTGIPVDKQARIFERFYQVEKEHIGSGVGLSLVQRLVELHHGRIELESAVGTGSTFSIYLPMDEGAYTKEEQAISGQETGERQVYSTNTKDLYFVDTEAPEDTSSGTEERKKETVLIVEDNVEISRFLSGELARSFNVLEAGNGEEALDLLKEKEVDLVLTDVMMPVMDGIKLCKNIKQNLRTCHIPVIILSAKTDLRDQMEGLQVGADDYIPKPFSMALVLTKIRNILRTHYRSIEHYSKSLEIEPDKIAFNPLDETFLKKAVQVVEKHMDNIEFSTDEFASEMNMSRSNLHLKMKAITGEPTIEFIRKMRFNHACKLLKEGRYNVAEISLMVGFNTPSYFATSFKKYIGCLPSEYAKNGGAQQN